MQFSELLRHKYIKINLNYSINLIVYLIFIIIAKKTKFYTYLVEKVKISIDYAQFLSTKLWLALLQEWH